MSRFPETRHELLRARYEFLAASACKSCEAPIEWWQTTNGKRMPFDPMPRDESLAITHWATCPASKDFRGNLPAPAPGAPRQRPAAHTDLPRALAALRERYNARVVVLVDDTGSSASWRGGIPAEDLRHELISAANSVRNAINLKETPTP